jgi:hypothetical protein
MRTGTAESQQNTTYFLWANMIMSLKIKVTEGILMQGQGQ